LENLKETDKFLDTYALPKLNKEITNNLNRTIRRNEIETAIKSLTIEKNPGQDGVTAEFSQILKKN
jgi:hypothetical protein